jgi:hypothetical protein
MDTRQRTQYLPRLIAPDFLIDVRIQNQLTRHVAKQQDQVALAARRGITRRLADGSCGYNGYQIERTLLLRSVEARGDDATGGPSETPTGRSAAVDLVTREPRHGG